MKKQSTTRWMSLALGVFTIHTCIAQDSSLREKTLTVTAPGAQLQQLGNDFKFTEGPAADKEGNVFFAV